MAVEAKEFEVDAKWYVFVDADTFYFQVEYGETALTFGSSQVALCRISTSDGGQQNSSDMAAGNTSSLSQPSVVLSSCISRSNIGGI